MSDLAFQATMAAYLVALVCLGIELAAKRRAPTELEAVSAARRVAAKSGLLVGSGAGAANTAGIAGTAATAGSTPSGSADVTVTSGQQPPTAAQTQGPAQPPSWSERFGRAAMVVTVVGLVANLISIVTRGIAAGRLPLANVYEFSAAFCFVAVLCWVVLAAKTKARGLGLFVLTPVTLLAFLAGTVLWQKAGPVVASLNSYWKWIHVTTVSISGSVLLVSGAASVMYLLRHRYDRKVTEHPDDVDLANSLPGKLPSLQLLDKIAYRTAIVAFPLYTFAIIAGALWAEVAWGRYWSWDPKETVAFISWVFYAGYLHARHTSGWRGVRAAWVNIVGFAAIIFNLFFINYVVTGLHSYAS
ncbi:c-type cytochrome biogenesis protein CcsB [Nakamurella aerolata]|uniref:c-type cytochrome biogenesis protein CcsB n=1 Tax=Nakamurella aerolata TaxID=1656892 RepID=UPI0031B60F74